MSSCVLPSFFKMDNKGKQKELKTYAWLIKQFVEMEPANMEPVAIVHATHGTLTTPTTGLAAMRLLSTSDNFLSSGVIKNNVEISSFLDLMENALKLLGHFVTPPGTTRSSSHTELMLEVYKRTDLPQGAVTLSSKQAELHIQLETAAGDLSNYPGFTTVSLLIYANLEDSADGFFSGMKPHENQIFKINSKVVTVTVSNRNTSHLKKPVMLTFYHLTQSNDSSLCVFWDSSKDGGTWSARGCSVVQSNPEYTVCSCNHLSSFAVLMPFHWMEAMLQLHDLSLITVVGLSLSLFCLFICILTFWFIYSIQSPRTTILLHLCISLFITSLIFVARVHRTESQVGCAVVAGLLHYFFLAALCWTCLEAIQLYRMVVLDFNTNFKTLYMMAGGYGVPAVVVGISASANAKGYGTERLCWLNLELIWAFLVNACIVVIINIVFILITAWKLVQKFSDVNPDLHNLQKIKAFIIIAVAELCVLDAMCIFGWFQFVTGTITTSYLFSIFGSFHGVMLFVIHCLCSKQVRDEYGNILSRFCAPVKKSHPELSYFPAELVHSGALRTRVSHLRS
ncbi:adhesion G protein-coupled receptor E5-like [Symphorus nematophorus]